MNFQDFMKGVFIQVKYLLYTLFMFLEIDQSIFTILI